MEEKSPNIQIGRDLQGNITVGNVYGAVENVQGSFNSYSQERNSLVEAAAEIQQLLDQLSKTYPTTTVAEKASVAVKAMAEIEKKPDTKDKIIKALKAGGTAALIELTNNPVVKILTPMLESLLDEGK